jgi:hypothetical protein
MSSREKIFCLPLRRASSGDFAKEIFPSFLKNSPEIYAMLNRHVLARGANNG